MELSEREKIVQEEHIKIIHSILNRHSIEEAQVILRRIVDIYGIEEDE